MPVNCPLLVYQLVPTLGLVLREGLPFESCSIFVGVSDARASERLALNRAQSLHPGYETCYIAVVQSDHGKEGTIRMQLTGEVAKRPFIQPNCERILCLNQVHPNRLLQMCSPRITLRSSGFAPPGKNANGTDSRSPLPAVVSGLGHGSGQLKAKKMLRQLRRHRLPRILRKPTSSSKCPSKEGIWQARQREGEEKLQRRTLEIVELSLAQIGT